MGVYNCSQALIDGGPWNVKGFCFSVRSWPLYHSIDDIESNRATYWIQAHGIPREMLSMVNGRKLGTMLGSVIEVEDPARVGNRGFLRIRVDINTHKPLATFCSLPCYSVTKKIRLKYELLKNFCYHCGRLGHMLSTCNHQVNPLLIRLGVVYDHNLVAEVIQKPAYTLPHHPLEFPYIPNPTTLSRRHESRPGSRGGGSFQIGPANGSLSQGLKRSRMDTEVTSTSPTGSPSIPVDGSTSLGQTSEICTQRDRLSFWHPDTNGTIYRNGSVTVAINGIKLDSPSWPTLL